MKKSKADLISRSTLDIMVWFPRLEVSTRFALGPHARRRHPQCSGQTTTTLRKAIRGSPPLNNSNSPALFCGVLSQPSGYLHQDTPGMPALVGQFGALAYPSLWPV